MIRYGMIVGMIEDAKQSGTENVTQNGYRCFNIYICIYIRYNTNIHMYTYTIGDASGMKLFAAFFSPLCARGTSR